MKITTVRAQAASVPLHQMTSIATRNVSSRDYLIVEVEDGESTGIGYAYIGTNGAGIGVAIVEQILAPVLLRENSTSPGILWDKLYQEALLSGRRGIVLRVISAIDIALWDLTAKRAQLPLADLLGGDSAVPVPAYASGGYYRPQEGDASDYVRREISANLEAGFTDHKIKVGGLSLVEDVARVRAAAETIAGTGRLALDANNSYRDVHEATDAARAFEDASDGLWWFEEPFMPDQIQAHHDLAARIATPIATGEIHQTRWEFRQLLESPGITILQPDVGVLGGVSEWMRVAQAAAVFDTPVAPHWHSNIHAHLASATPNCLTVEHFTADKDIYNFEDLLTSESRQGFRDGTLLIGSEPGIGIELDPQKLETYRTA